MIPLSTWYEVWLKHQSSFDHIEGTWNKTYSKIKKLNFYALKYPTIAEIAILEGNIYDL